LTDGVIFNVIASEQSERGNLQRNGKIASSFHSSQWRVM